MFTRASSITVVLQDIAVTTNMHIQTVAAVWQFSTVSTIVVSTNKEFAGCWHSLAAENWRKFTARWCRSLTNTKKSFECSVLKLFLVFFLLFSSENETHGSSLAVLHKLMVLHAMFQVCAVKRLEDPSEKPMLPIWQRAANWRILTTPARWCVGQAHQTLTNLIAFQHETGKIKETLPARAHWTVHYALTRSFDSLWKKHSYTLNQYLFVDHTRRWGLLMCDSSNLSLYPRLKNWIVSSDTKAYCTSMANVALKPLLMFLAFYTFFEVKYHNFLGFDFVFYNFLTIWNASVITR